MPVTPSGDGLLSAITARKCNSESRSLGPTLGPTVWSLPLENGAWAGHGLQDPALVAAAGAAATPVRLLREDPQTAMSTVFALS